MSSYEERMSKKYNFFSSEEDDDNKSKIQPNIKNQDEIENNQEDAASNEYVEASTDEENMLVPVSAWKKVLDQLGNLHEADKLMAEARERAAKAEAESEFLREKLKNTREELNTFKNKKRFFFF
tara:strand:+ start:732 stop:1103 length:372 start_codon:yes stop_codon:yes gene_type:complete